MQQLKTKNGSTVEVVQDIVHINGKSTVHITRVEFVDEYDADRYNRANNAWHIAKRPGDLPRSCAVISGRILPDEDVVAALRRERDEYRAAAAAKDAARKAEWQARREADIAACPAGKVPAVCTNYFDGIATYETLDGTAKFDDWERPADTSTGVYYFSAERIEEARRRTAEKAARDAEAAEKAAKKEAEEEARRAECFRQARETGKRVKLDSWITDRCHNGNDADCSFDQAVRWAMPDGSTTVTYTCCS